MFKMKRHPVLTNRGEDFNGESNPLHIYLPSSVQRYKYTVV